MTHPRIVASVVFILILGGCAGPDRSAPRDEGTPLDDRWIEVTEADLDGAQKDQMVRAVVAQQEMAATLMGELKAELESGGPAGAVSVCRDLAPVIAGHVATEHGLAIGRTSHRLRNPANVAPDWASTSVEGATGVRAMFVGPGGELGVLSPIKLVAPCLACHGPKEALADDVKAALAESYPDDRATGFSEGDLRGWFWVEVPATPAQTTGL
jgi:hypothetical protein